jgi:hypothetical protein
MKRKIPLRRVSEKRAQEIKVYSKKRGLFLDRNALCEICKVSKSRDVHHKKGRLNGNYLNEETWIAVCRPCHDWIHSNPSKARKLGLLV